MIAIAVRSLAFSMDGGQSLTLGFNHSDLFGWVGGMSSAVRVREKYLEKFLSGPQAAGQVRSADLSIEPGTEPRL